MTLKEGKHLKKGGATFPIHSIKMSPLKCHSLDCVPNVFKMLGITNKEKSEFLASLYKRGIPDDLILRYLNEEFKVYHIERGIYTIKDGDDRKFTEMESILEIKNMDEYVRRSIIKNNTAHISTIKYKQRRTGHLIVMSNIEGDIHLLDPQINLIFNISKIVRENNYSRELLDYIKYIVDIKVIVDIPREFPSKYKKPFFSELVKYALLHGELNTGNNYVDISKLKQEYKYKIISNIEDNPTTVFGTFYSIVDGFPIFIIDGKIEALDSRYKFMEFVTRSAPTKSKSRSKSNKLDLQYLYITELKYGKKYLILPRDKTELPLNGIFHLIKEGSAIFDIDGQREEINPHEYEFVKIIKKLGSKRKTRSAP
jgi:hypothetical protein